MPLAIVVLLVVCGSIARDAVVAGDGIEYFSMLQSLWNHAAPDQRPGDVTAFSTILARHDFVVASPHDGFFVNASGHRYSYHFWIYPLLAVPAKALLHLFGGDEFYALSCTNAALVVATVGFALRGARRRSPHRVAFVLLATVGPALWYVAWPHGEVFAWSCVVTSLVSLDDRRFSRAALFAALGALHAPPIAALAVFCVVRAAIDPRPSRPRRVLLALAGASVAGVAPLFYFLVLGVPNLIVAVGAANPHFASAGRVLAMAIDLDQGLLPFVPATFLLGVGGLACALVKGRWRPVGVAVTALAMLAASTQTSNFNAGCAGMNRYDVWVMPLFAWLAARELPAMRARVRVRIAAGALFGLAVLGQGLLTISGSPRDYAHEHGLLARLVLTHAPSLYVTDPEVFAERTFGKPLDISWRGLPEPIAFVNRYGTPTKLLVDEQSLDILSDHFDVDGEWLSDVKRRHATGSDPYFLTPPAGAVRQHCAVPLLAADKGVSFASGWYDAERLGSDEWRWMAKRASMSVSALQGAGNVVVLAGWVAPVPGPPPTLTISIDGEVVDRFTAPRQRFVRHYPLPSPRSKSDMAIETSDVVVPEGDRRALGFALLRAELTKGATPFGGPYARFEGDAWGEAFGEPESQSRCTPRAAEITLAPIPGASRATLSVGFWVPSDELSRPAKLRVLVDGEVVQDGLVHQRVRRRVPLRADVPHTVRLEPDEAVQAPFGFVAACVDVLRYARE